MALQLGRTFSDGIDRVVTRTGGVLFAALLAVQFLNQVSINTVVRGLFPPGAAFRLGMSLPVPASVGGVLLATSVLLGAAFTVVTSRALTRPKDQLSSFPAELYTRRIGRATLSAVGGGFVVGLSVAVGTAFLFVPGVFLAVCFLFFVFAVGVEDRTVVDALGRSWDLSRGNRLKLTVFVLFSGVIGGVVGIVGTLFDLAGAPVAGEVVVNTVSSVLFVVLYGMVAAAYVQLRDDDSGGFDGSESPDPLGSPATAGR